MGSGEDFKGGNQINAKLPILFAVLCESKCGAGIIKGLVVIHQRKQAYVINQVYFRINFTILLLTTS